MGHMYEMAAASGCDVSLDMGALPLLPGAQELSRRGIRSSLYEGNATRASCIANAHDGRATTHPAYPLLFDPQTCGGLLFAVPATEASAMVVALRGGGYPDAARIGTVTSDERGKRHDGRMREPAVTIIV